MRWYIITGSDHNVQGVSHQAVKLDTMLLDSLAPGHKPSLKLSGKFLWITAVLLLQTSHCWMHRSEGLALLQCNQVVLTTADEDCLL